MSREWSSEFETDIMDSEFMKHECRSRYSHSRKLDQYKEETIKSVREFTDRYIRKSRSTKKRLSGNDMYILYCDFCELNNYKRLNKSNFIRMFKLLVIRDEYIKNVKYSHNFINTISPGGHPAKAPVTYFYGIALIGKEVKVH